MSSNITKINRSIYYWEDFQARNLKESTVGRKGLSLFELKDMDIPIPEFFVISSNVFEDIISKSLLRDSQKLFEKGKNPEESEILESILKTDFSPEVLEEILTAYTRLSGFTDAWVSVRSSVVFPSAPDVSFSGIFSTELNIRGIKNLFDSVKRIYGSLFTDDVVAYASSKGINLSDVKIAVVVQKMIQAEVSGVAFTVDPITQDPSKLSIEAVFGLGDSIALGELTPDTYLLNKRELNIIEKHISPQDWMKVRMLGGTVKGKSNVEKIKISSNWSHRQKVEDKYLQEISKIALIVENKLRQAQNIEWVISGGRVWVLQSKDLYERSTDQLVIVEAKDFDTLGEVLKWTVDKYMGIGMLESKAVEHAKKIVQSNRTEKNSLTEKLINIAKKTIESKPQPVVTSTLTESKEDLLVSGIGASFGQVIGKVVCVDRSADVAVSKNDILLIKKYGNEMEALIVHSGGVILETGGVTSDTAILCREFDIPAIVGATNASNVLKDGDIVRIDGKAGSVYRERSNEAKMVVEGKSEPQQVHPVVEAYNEENLEGIDLLRSVPTSQVTETEKPSEYESKIPHDVSLPPSATKVFVNPNVESDELIDYVGNSHGLCYIDLDQILLKVGRHPLAFVEEKKFVEYSKDIVERICKYVDLAEGNNVLLSLGSASVADFKALKRGKDFEDENQLSIFGISHYINNKELLKRVLMIVKRLRNVYKKRNVDLAIHSPQNSTLVSDFKKSLSSIGLRRTSTFRVYAIIDTPTEVIMADEILDSKIDGLVLNMPRIVRVMQGFDINDIDARYNLGVNSAYKIVDAVVDVTRNTPRRVIVMTEGSKDLIKYSVQMGVYGVSVNYKDIKESRKLVSDEEAKLILGKK